MKTHNARCESDARESERSVGPETTVKLGWVLALFGSLITVVVASALWVTTALNTQQKELTAKIAAQQKESTEQMTKQAVELAKNATRLAEVATKLDSIVLGITKVNDTCTTLTERQNVHEKEDEAKWTKIDGRLTAVEQSGSPILQNNVRYITDKIAALETAFAVEKAMRERDNRAEPKPKP